MATQQQTKPWHQSVTLLVNGGLFIAASFVEVVDLLTGANVIRPIVGVFVSDPDRTTKVLTVITQVYTIANMAMRMRTTQAITRG